MRTRFGFCFALLAATSLFAQNRSGFVNPIPATRTFGSVVHPGGTSALPGVTRTTGSILHPGGAFPQIAIPGTQVQGAFGPNGGRGRFNRGGSVVAYPVAVPVYVGGYDFGGYDPSLMAPAAPPQQQAPNVIVIYPPAQQPTYSTYAPPAQPTMVEVPREQMEAQAPDTPEATHYLLAFKDHSIYSAVAYWVDGDTLHYFTAGNTHNQVSVSLVDRELTKRLNEGSGLEVKLPAPR